MSYVEEVWNKVEIRVLLGVSLVIQILLLCLAGFRKHIVSIRWSKNTDFSCRGPLAHMFHWLLWMMYLLADYVATVALAYLRDSGEREKDKDAKHLLIFWAPFFLVHLGGQDTITALSIEDNELWARHFLTLITQVGLAFYNYFRWNLKSVRLWPPAALMFAVGILKYGERIWALQRASMSSLRSSMITKPDPGPNYAKFMQEYTSSKGAGLDAQIRIEVERHNEKERQEAQPPTPSPQPDYPTIVFKAYEFFPRFKRLFVDLILSYKDREESQKYFSGLETKEAFKLIEIELSWMYEILHSKASVIYTVKYYGWASRASTLLVTIIALVLFAVWGHQGAYKRFDVYLTYVLIGAAVALEVGALAFMFMSFWTYSVLKEANGLRGKLADYLFPFQEMLRPMGKARWSDKMAQFSLINYSLLDRPHWFKSVMKTVGFKQSWDHYRYTTFAEVTETLKELVFQELKKKMNGIEGRDGYKRYTEHRGQWALQRKGYYKEFGWSVEAEFDESILLWHIATDLLFNDPPATEPEISSEALKTYREARKISQSISNYVMFLLIARPFMMPAGIGQIRFGDSSAEAKNFLQQDQNKDINDAAKKILAVSTEYEPADIKGDRSKSLLFDGCKLAHELRDELGKDPKRMWMLISQVWVEILCYAASKCSGQFHAKQLSKGGELLTVVWYLMAHLGMGEQYRIEQGHARAKLIVSK